MKKLMIAAAIVCAAVVSQASIVKWGTSSPISLNSTKLGNQTVQLFIVGVDGKDDVLVDTRTTTQNPAGQRGKLDVVAGTGQAAYDYQSTIAGGALVDGSNLDLGREYYIVITATGSDKVDYKYTSSAVASSGLSNTSLGTVTFGFTDKVIESGTDGWVAQSVPEPTSGLLLLLGVAGLALCRRRA